MKISSFESAPLGMYQGGLELQIHSNVLLRVSGAISSGYHFPRRSWRVEKAKALLVSTG